MEKQEAINYWLEHIAAADRARKVGELALKRLGADDMLAEPEEPVTNQDWPRVCDIQGRDI